MNSFCILIKRQHNCFRIMNIDESRDSPENGSKTSLNLHFTSLSSPSDRPFWPIFEVLGLETHGWEMRFEWLEIEDRDGHLMAIESIRSLKFHGHSVTQFIRSWSNNFLARWKCSVNAECIGSLSCSRSIRSSIWNRSRDVKLPVLGV